MTANRHRDTRPELALRSAVHRLGLRYRVSARPIPTLRRTVDILFRPAHVAVFLDGCFWHGCPAHHSVAKANAEYWSEKVRRNVERDRETDALLTDAGWLVIRVWEHEDPVRAAETVMRAVIARRPAQQRRRTRMARSSASRQI
jgi:DNA mismatch endonuclease (patch repair protein)